MSITSILTAAAIVGGAGLLIGIFLGIAGQKLAVETDPREDAIMGVLPGNNCGGCGYPGCSGLACAIVKGEAELSACPVGGAEVTAKIAEIMGKNAGEQKRLVAYVKCAGTCGVASCDYGYTGIEDCSMMQFMQGKGPKSCNYGCHGYGDCVKVCPFDAIHIIDGIARVDHEACKACGKCIDACPNHLIEMVPYDQKVMVQCNSSDIGKHVMKVCKVGCVGCRLCERHCEANAITVDNNIAHIDYNKCTNCGVCVEKCPKKVIQMIP